MPLTKISLLDGETAVFVREIDSSLFDNYKALLEDSNPLTSNKPAKQRGRPPNSKRIQQNVDVGEFPPANPIGSAFHSSQASVSGSVIFCKPEFAITNEVPSLMDHPAVQQIDGKFVWRVPSWFSLDAVSDYEMQTLPRWAWETESAYYLEVRNFIIFTWRRQPAMYMSFTAIRRAVLLDVQRLLFLFRFLECEEIINHGVTRGNKLVELYMYPSVQPMMPARSPTFPDEMKVEAEDQVVADFENDEDYQ